MNSFDFNNLINNRILILDGATGSELQKAGMESGCCPEKWILDHKDVVIGLQKEYIKSGSDIVYAPTFTANRIKLEEYGLEEDIKNINKELVAISKKAIMLAAKELEDEGEPVKECYVAGDITMTGKQLYPMGTLSFEELVDIYKEQVRYLDDAGVDLIVVETMMSLQECRAAVIAIKETSDLPIMVTLSFESDKRTLFGTDPATAVNILQSMGVDAIGANCSSGADLMLEIVNEMIAVAKIPVIAKPNIGMPKLVNGKTAYSSTPEEYAEGMKHIIKAGASIIGGCCGTNPECIKLINDIVKEINFEEHRKHVKENEAKANRKRILSSERTSVDVADHSKFFVIGERINPTGKKMLQAALRENNLDYVINMAEEQIEYGADILDVNVGMNGIDETEMLYKVMIELTQTVNTPLSIDTSVVSAMEYTLRHYPGRALMNSISLSENTDALLQLCKKYGAMFVLLPLSESGLPKNLEEKMDIINTILKKALDIGIPKESIVVDGLVTTVGANKNAAVEALETMRYCTEELDLLTVCGLSNISFGLPERSFVNAAFLTLAINNGLTMAIANPMQELLMNTAYATDLLLNRPDSDTRYVERITVFNEEHRKETVVTEKKVQNSVSVKEEADNIDYEPRIYQCVLKGRKESIIGVVKDCMEEGMSAEDIVNKGLIPGINKVGDLFASGRYFLPQLMKSADTMKEALDYVEPFLDTNSTDNVLGKIVIATVKGDIHDIGKNLVAIMLKNYGFTVYDLGKNVAAEDIVAKAKEVDADIIGLSALMTTTMMEMKNVVDLVRSSNIRAKVMIGGAVVTEDFSVEIGSDGYSEDANEAVKVAKKLCGVE